MEVIVYDTVFIENRSIHIMFLFENTNIFSLGFPFWNMLNVQKAIKYVQSSTGSNMKDES